MSKTFPCDRCNMDDGSPVCLRDARCPNKTAQTSAANSNFLQQFDDCKAMVKRMEAVMLTPKAQWILMSPDGRVWQGDQQEVARALLLHLDISARFGGSKP